MKKIKCVLFMLCCFFISAVLPANATTLDFEDLPDLIPVGDFYSSYGIHFSEAISLTAGFSLNEIDFPPSSGTVAIGDDWGPMEITFDTAAENIFANFTYSTQLTFTAYDESDSFIGSFINPVMDNYGNTELISLNFSGVSRLVIEGDPLGASYIMDEFNFDLASGTVPEPSTIFLLCTGLIGGALVFRRKKLIVQE